MPCRPASRNPANPDDATHTTNKIVAVRSFVSPLAIVDGSPEQTRPDDLSARDRSVRPENSLLGTYQTQLVTVPLAPYSPAFFEYSDSATGRRLAAALDERSALVGPDNPAQRGHVVVFFLNGLGAVAPGTQPASGEPSPSTVFATTAVAPTVTIGGKSAHVQFSGLAPSLVGLYQVNAVVPDDVDPGVLPSRFRSAA